MSKSNSCFALAGFFFSPDRCERFMKKIALHENRSVISKQSTSLCREIVVRMVSGFLLPARAMSNCLVMTSTRIQKII